MADLVHVGLEAITADRASVIGQPLRRDVDDRRGRISAGPHVLGISARLAVLEIELAAGGDRAEGDPGDVGPHGKRLHGKKLSGPVERGDVVGDRVALARVERVGVAAPGAAGDEFRNFVIGPHRRRLVGRHAQLVGAAVGVIPGPHVDVIGAAGRRRERDPGIGIYPGGDVVVLENEGARGIANPQICVGEAEAGQRNGDRLARGQLDREPIMVAVDLELVGDRLANADRRASRRITRNIHHCL